MSHGKNKSHHQFNDKFIIKLEGKTIILQIDKDRKSVV